MFIFILNIEILNTRFTDLLPFSLKQLSKMTTIYSLLPFFTCIIKADFLFASFRSLLTIQYTVRDLCSTYLTYRKPSGCAFLSSWHSIKLSKWSFIHDDLMLYSLQQIKFKIQILTLTLFSGTSNYITCSSRDDWCWNLRRRLTHI